MKCGDVAHNQAMPSTKTPQHGGARPGAGRPAIEPGEPTVTITIRVTKPQRAKFEAIGGSVRFRAWLDRVKL